MYSHAFTCFSSGILALKIHIHSENFNILRKSPRVFSGSHLTINTCEKMLRVPCACRQFLEAIVRFDAQPI